MSADVHEPLVADQSGFRRPEVRARYEQYLRDHHGELDMANLAETMWQAGERNAIDMMQSFVDMNGRIDHVRHEIDGLGRRVDDVHRLLDALWHRSDDDPSLPLPF